MNKQYLVFFLTIAVQPIAALVKPRYDRRVILNKQAILRQTSNELNELIATKGSKATKAVPYAAMKEKLIKLQEDGVDAKEWHKKLDTWYNDLPSV